MPERKPSKDTHHIHVHIEGKLYRDIKRVMDFHGGISRGVRLALTKFVSDVDGGKIQLSPIAVPIVEKDNEEKS